MDRQLIMDAGDFSDKGIKRCLEKYFYISANPSISICNPKGGWEINLHGTARQLPALHFEA